MTNKRVAKHVSDMEIDEISLVDRPANQHALVTIAKRRAPKEETMPDDKFFFEDGTEVDTDALELGDTVYDSEGNEFVFSELDDEDDRELATAGVSKAFETETNTLSGSILDELSKAVTDSDRYEVLSKALAQNEVLSKRLEDAERIAKSERDLRLEREYISKAAEYNVPIPAEDLGPVLMRMADTMSYEDCSVIHKALTASGEMLFEEAGFKGEATNDDPFAQVQAAINESVSKSDGQMNLAEATAAFFEANPSAYDAYTAGQK